MRIFREAREVCDAVEGISSRKGTGVLHERRKDCKPAGGPTADGRPPWIDDTLLAKQSHGRDAVIHVHNTPVASQAVAIALSVSR